MKPILNPLTHRFSILMVSLNADKHFQRKGLVLLIIILSPLFWRGVGGEAFGQHFLQKEQKAGDPKLVYTRISGGTALSFYNNNNLHSANTRPGAAFYGNVSEEIRMHQDIFFVGGLEYQHSAMAFNSYYFTPGSYALYNGHYNYNYNLTLQEGRLNLLLRYTGGDELRNPFTGYVEGGYVLRYLINTQMKVTDDSNGKHLFNGSTQADFIGKTLGNSFSSGLKINVGVQRNFLRTHRAWFLQIGLMYGLAQFNIHETFTPSALNIKSGYAQFGLGYKF